MGIYVKASSSLKQTVFSDEYIAATYMHVVDNTKLISEDKEAEKEEELDLIVAEAENIEINNESM